MDRDSASEERRRLAEAVARGEPARCPRCGARMAINPIAPSRALPYVRRRIWLICPACRHSVVVDVRPRAGEDAGGSEASSPS